MRRAEREPVAVLAVASGAAAIAIALANVASLALARDEARLRDLRPLAALRVLLDEIDVPLLALLPRLVHAPFDLHAGPTLVGFAALAVLVYLACAWAVAALVAPVVVPLARRPGAETGAPGGLTLAVLAAAVAPVVGHRLGLWLDVPRAALAAASVAIVAALWWIAARLVGRRAGVMRALTGALAWITIGGTTLALAGGAYALATRAPAAARPAAPAGAPNVLLVSIDTLRPDHLGSYGYARDTSPQIDALAAAGARFTTAVAPSSWTLPSHVSLLTALPPEVHGVALDGRRLDRGVLTLTEVLRAHGWATAGFVSGPYLDAGYGYARGFDVYDDYSAVRISQPATLRARTSPTLVDAVTRWLDGWDVAEPRRPFFVFVHMWDAHYDFNPPPPYDTMFDPDYRGTITGDDFLTGTAIHAGMDARDLAHVIALYDGEIRYTDEWLGRIVERLRARGLLDDTIVVVTSDHGEEFFEHGEKGHHNALYDESIRVPLVVRHPPRVAAGTVVDRQVRLIDVAPTILALAAVAPPPSFGLDPALGAYGGRSLASLVAPGASPDAVPAIAAFADLQPHALRTIRHEDRKLIVGPFGTNRQQLFDVRADPGERHDLAATTPAERAALRTELDQWHTVARTEARATRDATVSKEHQDALRALGYVE